MCEMHQGVEEMWRESHPQGLLGGPGSRSKNQGEGRINRIWDLHASEVNDILQ